MWQVFTRILPTVLDDALMGDAPAQASIHVLHHGLTRGARVLVQKSRRRHQHPRRAKAAVKCAVLNEGLMQGVELAI